MSFPTCNDCTRGVKSGPFTFTEPAAWRALLARIEARTGVSVDTYGLYGISARYWTSAELDAAEAMLSGFVGLAEAGPGRLDVPLHLWATQNRQTIIEARWYWARLHGMSAKLRKRREAERRAALLAREMAEGVPA